jgi:hypothetical protein
MVLLLPVFITIALDFLLLSGFWVYRFWVRLRLSALGDSSAFLFYALNVSPSTTITYEISSAPPIGVGGTCRSELVLQVELHPPGRKRGHRMAEKR